MTLSETFSKAEIVGNGKTRHPLGMSVQYDVPDLATHILVRPTRRKGNVKIFIVFIRIKLKKDYKPKNNSGKYFCRPDGTEKCLVAVYNGPTGWHYDVRWSK